MGPSGEGTHLPARPGRCHLCLDGTLPTDSTSRTLAELSQLQLHCGITSILGGWQFVGLRLSEFACEFCDTHGLRYAQRAWSFERRAATCSAQLVTQHTTPLVKRYNCAHGAREVKNTWHHGWGKGAPGSVASSCEIRASCMLFLHPEPSLSTSLIGEVDPRETILVLQLAELLEPLVEQPREAHQVIIRR